jgi:glycolate oxidase
MDAEARLVNSIVQDLGKLLRPDPLLTRSEHLMAYESDVLTAFRQRPLAVAIPLTVDEVIGIVRACSTVNVPFVARGSCTFGRAESRDHRSRLVGSMPITRRVAKRC